MPSLGLPIYGQSCVSGAGPRPGPGIETRRWRTLEEAGAASAERTAAPHGDAPPPDAFSRRGFLQILGASAALVGLEGCRPPRERLVSWVNAPAGVTPTIANHYATALGVGGHAVGLVVTSWEGKPTKVEGNPDHRASLGGTDAQLQAQVLELYEPARLAGFRRGKRALAWTSVLSELSALAKEHGRDGGARLRFLVEPTSSPTLAELRARVAARFPRARFVAWSATGGAAAAGAAITFGRPLEPTYALSGADVVLALDADFLAREGEHLRHAREFAARREGPSTTRPQGAATPGMNRLYVAESDFTVTGGAADHRFRMRSSEVLGFARAVAGALAKDHGLSQLAPLALSADGARARIVSAVAKDLAGARGRSLVVPGERQPAALHALAAAMNEALGNVGATVNWYAPVLAGGEAGAAALQALAAELRAGSVDTLVVTAWNPLHTAPADLDLRGAVTRVKETVVLAAREDETVRAAQFRLAALHPLESWGDLRARDGSASLVQPLVAPLVEGTTEADLLAALLDEGAPVPGASGIVREGWRRRGGFPAPPPPAAGSAAAAAGVDMNRPRPADPFERRWEEWLSAGLVAGTVAKPEEAAADLARVAQALAAAPAPASGLELGFAPDYKVGDGRLLENAWLQELPHPVTKLTWENAAHLSPTTARRLGVADGDVLELGRAGRKVSAPALVVPGHADDAVTVALGYGQAVTGAVGKGAGFDAYALRTSEAPWFAGGLEVTRTGRKTRLAVTQGHFSMEGREIALATEVGKLEEEQPVLDRLRKAQPDILGAVDYAKEPYSWGMAIDLTKCIGCGACTVACQAENNIPVVGKEQVLKSREMHWIRVDRYFEGPIEDPSSVSQPLGCVHCEAAPCEYVCPVNATVHTEDGLNAMVYNRCVGTRYCSNNCPYKVRRFNYLDYHQAVAPTLQMLMNPDVTVRSRGVMEKCTYCTQRIQRTRIDARATGRKLGPDEVVPACGQACPAQAITFGNLADPTSQVARKHADARRYNLLHELGTRPRTAYLVKLTNPNPDLA